MKRLLMILILIAASAQIVHAEECVEIGADGTIIEADDPNCYPNKKSPGGGATLNTGTSGGTTDTENELGGPEPEFPEDDTGSGETSGGTDDIIIYLERAPTTNLLVAQEQAHLCGQFWDEPMMEGLVKHNFCDIVETRDYTEEEGITNLENTRFVCTLIGGEWRWDKWRWADSEGAVESILREDEEGEPTRNWINLTAHPESYGEEVQELIDDTSIEGIGCGENGAQALVTKYSPPEGDAPKTISSSQCLNDQCYLGAGTQRCAAIGQPSANNKYTCMQLGGGAAWVSDVTQLAQAMLERPVESGKHILNCGPRRTAINKPQSTEEEAYCELIKLNNDAQAEHITVGILLADPEDDAGLERVRDEILLMYPSEELDTAVMSEESYIEAGEGYIFFTIKGDSLDENSLLDDIIGFFAGFFSETKEPAQIQTTSAEQIFLVIDDNTREYAVEYREERCRPESRDQRVIVSRVGGVVQEETCYTIGKWRRIIQDREALT